MKPFLKTVAEDLYRQFDGKLDNIAVVFPNKRAGLFFNEYLLECSGNAPIWSPQYLTISELFEQNSNYVKADNILLVSKLYKEYVRPRRTDESEEEYRKSVESLDSFYYWGEILIRDFDDIDKNLADAKKLFSNISDLHAMGTGKDTLEPEQANAIKSFFKNFDADNMSDIKKNFKNLWERLYAIYSSFKESLRKINVAYEGMLYRDVVERGEELTFKHDKYIFVGFNALNGAETKLFDILKKQGKALFYWDYDKHYTANTFHEAGLFMRKNLEKFPNALKEDCFNNLSCKKNVKVVSTDTDNIQARYVARWLDSNLTGDNVETAIVLCDETLLEPVLHSIPSKANGHTLESMNVTMGYPISNTPVYSLVKQLVDLHTRGWSEKHNSFNLNYVCKILKHPYIIQGSENAVKLYTELVKNNVFYPTDEQLHKDGFLSLVFKRSSDNGEWIDNIISIIYTIAENRTAVAEERNQMYDLLFSEAIMKVHSQAQRLKALHSAGELNLQLSSIGKLFMRMLVSMSVPFHGEPVVGLQVMGLLETRNLDFKNVILLSVNEGSLPKASGENSYIPYNLRRAFGLTLSEQRDSIYAYYFYRLLQRADNVTLVYNNSASEKNRGECSRYILQILGENLFDVEKVALSAKQESCEIEIKEINKTPEMIKRLRERFDKGFCANAMEMTPSAINKYINCGHSFFYYYILGLKPIQEINTELKPTDFGTIFHTAAELLYDKIVENGSAYITRNMLQYYIDNEALLYEFVDKAFKKEFFKGGNLDYNGEQLINKGVLFKFLKRLTITDADYADFRYIGSEKKIKIEYPLNCNGFTVKMDIGGKIDRIDVKDGTVNIVDYKTGSPDSKSSISLDDIFENNAKTAGNRLQAFLYSIALDEIIKSNVNLADNDELSWIENVKSSGATKVSPTLLYMRKRGKSKSGSNDEDSKRESYVIKLYDKTTKKNEPVYDISTLKNEFMIKLNEVIAEIFDIEKPFTFAGNEKNCEYCDYKKICRR